MKLLDTRHLREADRYTVLHEPVTEERLMERAAIQLTERLKTIFPSVHPFYIFCGTGNNGGDGLIIARLLQEHGNSVRIFLLRSGKDVSEATRAQLLKAGEQVTEISTQEDFPSIPANAIVIDALFGSGINRPLQGMAKALINHINSSGAFIVAIDVPSGLAGEDNRRNDPGAIIAADLTLAIQQPRLSFFFAENSRFVGRTEIVPIGLHPGFIAKAPAVAHTVDHAVAAALYRPRSRFSHKGTFGHAMVIAGSYGKMGAAVLATRAVLRSGAGLVTAHIPECGYTILQAAFPEAMAETDAAWGHISMPPGSPEKYNAVAVGPGLGTHPETCAMLQQLLSTITVPLVMDADALNLLSENKEWLEQLPENAVLTPHPKEFDRLAGPHADGFSRFKSQVEFSLKHRVFVVLKGAHTSITDPQGNAWINTSGNPGMATGGTGDVLTGIIAGLLSQGYPVADACVLGVYIHGLAGDLAASALSEDAMIASDVTGFLGRAFLSLGGTESQKGAAGD